MLTKDQLMTLLDGLLLVQRYAHALSDFEQTTLREAAERYLAQPDCAFTSDEYRVMEEAVEAMRRCCRNRMPAAYVIDGQFERRAH